MRRPLATCWLLTVASSCFAIGAFHGAAANSHSDRQEVREESAGVLSHPWKWDPHSVGGFACQDSRELVGRVLKLCTDESTNPDLRDRGWMYWRTFDYLKQASK